jgi:AcrR family transcriptional regulator
MPARRIVHLPAGGGTEAAMGRYSLVARFQCPVRTTGGEVEVAAAAGVSRQLIYFHYQNRAGLLLAMARHQDRSSGFQREVAATRALDPVPGFETLLRAWCGYLAEILPVARALEAAYITGDEGGDAWRDRMTELREAFRLALERIAAEGRLAPAWTGETAADWAWARVQPGSWAALVGMRGWDPREYTERTAGSLLAELVTAAGGKGADCA